MHLCGGGKTVKLPGYSITVVDTTGAGDNFAAGLTYGLCKGYSLKDCCRLGNASGAITAGQLASNGAVTSFMQLQEFMIRQDGCGVGGEEGR